MAKASPDGEDESYGMRMNAAVVAANSQPNRRPKGTRPWAQGEGLLSLAMGQIKQQSSSGIRISSSRAAGIAAAIARHGLPRRAR
jgi:hypothetical protein